MTERTYRTKPSAVNENTVPTPPEAPKKDLPAQEADVSAQTNKKDAHTEDSPAPLDIAQEMTQIFKMEPSTEEAAQPVDVAPASTHDPKEASFADSEASVEESAKPADISQEPTRVFKMGGASTEEAEKPVDISQEPTRIIKMGASTEGQEMPSDRAQELVPVRKKDASEESAKPADIALEPTQIIKMGASAEKAETRADITQEMKRLPKKDTSKEAAKPVDISQEPTRIIKLGASAEKAETSADPSQGSKKDASQVSAKPADISQEPTWIIKNGTSAGSEPPADIAQAATQIIKKDEVAEALRAETTQAALARINKEDVDSPRPETTQAALARINKEDVDSPRPAKLPKHSRAAAAQRLGDLPDKRVQGFTYEAAHHPLHVSKWWTKRHWKRKNLRSTQERYVSNEHRVTMRMFLPIGIVTILVVVVATSLLTYLNATTNATTAQYQTQIITLADILPQDNLKMYDSNGNLLYQAIDQGVQTSEPLDKISKNLQNAEIDIEDQTFWNNSGYDITGIVRAAVSDLESGHVVSGGSTITQQLIKNTVVGNSDTAQRKLQEIELAPEVTRYYTKQDILAMYLNTVYYANGAYGAEAAAQLYFGLQDKPNDPASNQLDIAQAATLAGIPSNPDLRNPIAYPQNSLLRTQDVLHQMYVLKTINAQQYNAALQEIRKPGFASYHAPAQSAHALALSSFTNYALTELASDLHVKVADLSRSGLKVTTTVNANLQTQVLSAAQRDIAEIRTAHNITDSSVVMINPNTGAIETLIGNIDPAHNVFNVATQGFRQSGSTMKAFTYSLAFEHGISPGEQTNDVRQTFYYNGVPYSPDNYGGVHHGWITYREALDWSLNIDAVHLELTPQVGPINDYNYAESLGLGPTNGTVNETFTLGALGVHLLNETSAFGSFATGGVHVPYHAINTVTNSRGKVIYSAPTTGKRVLTPQAAYILSNVLSDNATRDKEFLPCDALDLYVNNNCGGTVIPAAVKTGTTDNFVDNLTIGYTPSLVTGVWSGNDNNSPMNNIVGITGAGTIWHDAMMMALQGKPIQHFTNPGGVIYSQKYHDLALG
ncbi:MAG TPA: transglycosylase domain-containing protein [Ktedonobacteraceae bacterium]|nr:transglycosylase domain-containing protein [Ktedonobacteraceae bacterium]